MQRTIVERVRSRAAAEPVALDEAESKNVLRAYGIATPAETLVTSPAAAVKAAERIGYPVVLKAVSPTLLHKSDVGAVALNLATPEELTAAYDRMARSLSDTALSRDAGLPADPRRRWSWCSGSIATPRWGSW